MAKNGSTNKLVFENKYIKKGGDQWLWFLGFIGALVYYLNYHSGTFWLVVIAFLKAIVWPAYLVYHLLLFMRV